jgi:type II secretory pathway pseudopilin PulG
MTFPARRSLPPFLHFWWKNWRASGTEARKGQRGFVMAMLMALITIMGIMLIKGIPAITTEVQREHEAELIFRGESIAKAIRIFAARSGRYPNALMELEMVKPRIIRKIYKDPMTESGEWDLLYAVQPGATGDTHSLPIVGVKSKSQKNSFKIYNNKTIYSDWAFSATSNLLGVPAGVPGPSGPVKDTGSQDNGGGRTPKPGS